MTTLCHCKDKICYPKIGVVVGLQSEQGKKRQILCLYMCSLSDILVYGLCFCAV